MNQEGLVWSWSAEGSNRNHEDHRKTTGNDLNHCQGSTINAAKTACENAGTTADGCFFRHPADSSSYQEFVDKLP
jgi:hypothetical protein